MTVSTRGTATWHQEHSEEGEVRPAVVEPPYAFDPDTG